MEFIERFARHVEVNNLLIPGEKIVVACSGGVDSMVLLHAVKCIGGYELTAAHLDHGLRPDSARDRKFVENFCRGLDVEIVSKRIDIGSGGESGVEERARDYRYDWLAAVAAEKNATAVLTAHHADDQVETILFRLMRGTSVTGLAGIPEQRRLAEGVRLVRPLLSFTREEIEAYAAENGVEYVEDSTNKDTSFARNRIRHDILPVLEQAAPEIRGSILALAGAASDAREVLDGYSAEIIEAARDETRPAPVYRLDKLQGENRYTLGNVLDDALARLGCGRGALTRRHYEKFFSLVNTSRPHCGTDFPGGVWVEVDRGVLCFSQSGDWVLPEQVKLPVPGEVNFGKWKISAEQAEMSASERIAFYEEKSGLEEIVSAAAAGGELVVRVRREGDRFRPLGAPGEKRLSDFLSDLKLPMRERDFLPLVTNSSGEIIWVAGCRISEGARVGEDEAVCIMLTAERR